MTQYMYTLMFSGSRRQGVDARAPL